MFYQFYEHIKNRYFDQLCTLPAVMRQAMIFKYTCEEIPLSIRDDDLIPGWYGAESDEGFQIHEHREFPAYEAYTPEELAVKDELNRDFGIIVRFDRAHSCIDNAKIITQGLVSFEQEIRAEMDTDSLEKRQMLQAMLITIDAVRIYTRRFAELADSMFRAGGDQRLVKMRDAMLRVPYEPARNIYEAICAVWTMHTLIPISEISWASVSLGRVDQYLWPLYKQSLAEGETRENVRAYLKNLYKLLNTFNWHSIVDRRTHTTYASVTL